MMLFFKHTPHGKSERAVGAENAGIATRIAVEPVSEIDIRMMHLRRPHESVRPTPVLQVTIPP